MRSWSQLISKLEELGIRHTNNRFQGPCPIHGGDNFSAFCLYEDTGIWKCFTHQCHEEYGTSIYGLAKALNVSYCDKNHTLKKFYDKDIKLKQEEPEFLYSLSREKVRSLLQIPCEYYLRRHYSKNILDKYDIGTCTTPGKFMYNRAVVPIYNFEGNTAIGFTGRDITNTNKKKWLNSYGLKKTQLLYNAWYAHEHIKKYKTAILVEGPGDLWKLEEAGIQCGLALMGLTISQYQKILLSKMGVMNILILMDNGTPGQTAAKKLYSSLNRLYNVCMPPDLPYEDIGEAPISWISENIEKILRVCFPSYKDEE